MRTCLVSARSQVQFPPGADFILNGTCSFTERLAFSYPFLFGFGTIRFIYLVAASSSINSFLKKSVHTSIASWLRHLSGKQESASLITVTKKHTNNQSPYRVCKATCRSIVKGRTLVGRFPVHISPGFDEKLYKFCVSPGGGQMKCSQILNLSYVHSTAWESSRYKEGLNNIAVKPYRISFIGAW
jgi:hypothetical protein